MDAKFRIFLATFAFILVNGQNTPSMEMNGNEGSKSMKQMMRFPFGSSGMNMNQFWPMLGGSNSLFTGTPFSSMMMNSGGGMSIQSGPSNSMTMGPGGGMSIQSGPFNSMTMGPGGGMSIQSGPFDSITMSPGGGMSIQSGPFNSISMKPGGGISIQSPSGWYTTTSRPSGISNQQSIISTQIPPNTVLSISSGNPSTTTIFGGTPTSFWSTTFPSSNLWWSKVNEDQNSTYYGTPPS